MFTRFFIDRPIFASVLSIIITLAGGIALFSLPIAQYPEITPPTVEVSAVYPGANANVVVDTVAAPIEQQVNGVEGMMYMASQCTNDGSYSLTITFQHGVDLNIAQVLVQNRVALAQPILPDLVKRRGVSVKKKSPNVLMIVNLYSPDGSRDNLYLSNYATIQLKDELARLPGVGDISYIGQRDYSLRVWLDPGKMAFRNLTANDVVEAVQAQNVQVAAGQLGQPPAPAGLAFQYTMTTLGRLANPEEFGEMILKTNPGGGLVRLRDVARIELGAQGYDQTCTMDGQPSVALSVYQLPGSNALEVARLVRAKVEELRGRFPQGVDSKIVYDTTPFINESINEVFKTLRDAVILVALVVLLFLQNWRSALIPLVAVPVAVIGTFAVMAAMGFSLNNLTLFGLVLAIGIVVDDAIVVVEAVEHHIEHGLSPRDATIKVMDQVSGPVIAIGLVLFAVFIPCAFISGIIGQFFRQFALTIAVSTLISAFNSLTLSPALSALLLKPRTKGVYQALPRMAFVLFGAYAGYWLITTAVWPWVVVQLPSSLASGPGSALLVWGPSAAGILGGVLVGWLLGRPLNFVFGVAFGWFNVTFDFTTRLYTRAVGVLLLLSVPVLVIYCGLLVFTYFAFQATPTGFIPAQDKGFLLVNVQLPDAASSERTSRVMSQIEEIAKSTKGVRHTVAITGQSILMNANAPNFGAMYLMLDDFHDRAEARLSGPAIAKRLQSELQDAIGEGVINVFEPPPVDGLGTAGGFKIMIEDRGDVGLVSLQDVADRIVVAGDGNEKVQGLFTSFRANTPWLYLDIDREQAKAMGVSMTEIFSALQVYLGSLYVNDFNRFGRTWQVNVQGSADFRKQIDDLKQLKVRNDRGQMVPFAAVARVRDVSGPVMVMRYNMYPAAAITGSAGPNASSGQAIAAAEELTRADLLPSMRLEWTELALLQLQTGNTAMLAFALAVVLVFLILAAQYESLSLPLAVIMVVPMCLLFSVVGVLLARMDINVFTQIGFVVLVGLACKNAILIVEFAKTQREAGVPRYEATLQACQLRLRPIIMTSFAFILGVVPLMISQGAGAEMRQTLGIAVFAGMLGVTLFGIFLTPVFFYTIQWVTDWRNEPNQPHAQAWGSTLPTLARGAGEDIHPHEGN
ncbi:MAG: efflux RND transporter permease subunit [Planctomycetes bacterium]|nr:efflux RND transporter permease subunit [Planctomycetota bacterium]